MNNLLVISALGKDRPGIVKEVSEIITGHGGNIMDSRMTVLGGEFALILLIGGQQQAINAIQQSLPSQSEQLGLTMIARPTEQRISGGQSVPCRVEVVALDHPGIVKNVAEFFSSQQINIEQLDTRSYSAAHTGSPMFSITMTISVPAELTLKRLREDFSDFCDNLNLDASIETLK